MCVVNFLKLSDLFWRLVCLFSLQRDSVDVPEGKKMLTSSIFLHFGKMIKLNDELPFFFSFSIQIFNIRFKILYREKYQSVFVVFYPM